MEQSFRHIKFSRDDWPESIGYEYGLHEAALKVDEDPDLLSFPASGRYE